MSRVTGTVVEVRDGRAVVECEAQAASCGACASGRGCSWRHAAGTRRLEVDALRPDGALQPGDAVELAVDDARLLAAAARLYLPPLAGLLLGPAALRIAGFEAGATPLVAAAIGLGLGVLVARRWTARGAPVDVRRA
ncbi:MAG TPA: SoxR reducing system RseC family protein [Steroidobacteraceae bacterium]